MSRRFGPTNAPGTVVIERAGGKPIQPGELGVTVLTGVTKMGPTDELIYCPTKKEFLRRCGGRIAESLLPDVALEFFNMSQGAGELWIQRVTDGNEDNSFMVVKNRDQDKDIVRFEASNGGIWGNSISVIIDDGVIDPLNEWSLIVMLGGEEILNYERLSSDPDNPFYFIRTINDDNSNVWIKVEDLLVGESIEYTPNLRPEQLTTLVGFSGGVDGFVELNANDFTNCYDIETSLINSLFGKNKGLVKLATPGIGKVPAFTDTEVVAIHKAGLQYAGTKNYQYRAEIPPDKTTAQLALDYMYGTSGIGRNDFGVVSFPSWGSISNPEGAGLKQIPLTGSILGREAKTARDFQGYHKAAAGIDMVLSNILKLPFELGEKAIETLNPRGINAIKVYRGNVILWGDRTISSDPTWKWKHQREQMSYYENVLRENFDWIIFMINDRLLWRRALATLNGFFLPEWQPKRALRGDTFEEAAILKIDEENNTNASLARGELNAEIALRLADTVERFIITIGKRGIFEEIQAAA